MEILHNIMLIISTPVIGLLLIGVTNRALHRLTGSEIGTDKNHLDNKSPEAVGLVSRKYNQ